MKTKLFKTATLCSLILTGGISYSNAQAFTEGFNDITTLASSGWAMQNNSTPVGLIPNWFQGTNVAASGPFDAQSGPTNSYAAANYNFVSGNNTISGWLMTPNRTFKNGDVFTFYTRKPSPDTYPDRMEVRLSTNGASTNVGTGSAAVGDFTTVLLTINPTLVTGVYPTAWTQYSITISGLSAPTSGRIAFRYFVTSGGPSGLNSDYIGLDNVVYTPYVCPPFTMSAAGPLSNATAGTAYSSNISQTGALGTPTFTLSSGTLPNGLTLASNGTISGTPISTGTFNFMITVTDNSGCSSSENYSIDIDCPVNPISFSPAPSFCQGDGLYTLVEGSPSGGSYSGTGVSGLGFDPSAGSQTITYTFTDSYSCTHASDYSITVNNTPAVAFTSPVSVMCINNNPLTLMGGTPAGGSYTGTGVASGVLNPMNAGVGNHLITYSYSDANNCSNQATFSIAVDACASIDENSISTVELVPNPTTGKFTLNLKSNIDYKLLRIVDVQGREIDFTRPNLKSEFLDFDISNQASGIYFVHIEVDGKLNTLKVQKH